MDAQTLGALANIVKEAIAEAVAPLHDRIRELEGRESYDDKPLLARVQELIEGAEKRVSGLVPEPYDDTALVARVAKQLEDFRSEWVAPVAIDGVDGKDGAPGIDGRDALHLEVLPAIDEAKSYQRGTYAKHAGGLWRSFEQTHGMRGWECIVDGVKSLQVVANGKEFTVIAERSSGEVNETKALIPVQVYKGVFTDAEYQQGDTATWAGSLWHCNVTGTKAKPGDGSGDWTLAVKKGRDGKDTVTVKTADPVQIGGRNG